MALTIWCNAHFSSQAAELLQANIGSHRLIFSAAAQASNLTAGGVDPLLGQADIAFGQPEPAQAMGLAKLKWIHLTSAGYTRYDTSEFRAAITGRRAVLTNSSSVYAEPCAQHVLAMMLGMARQLPQCVDEQRGERAWRSGEVRSRCCLLEDQLVLIYGFGSIGRRLAELLAPFRMRVIGVRRNTGAGETSGLRTIAPADADAMLGEADHVVNILPASATTEEFFHADRLGKLKRSAVFYNIGRGSTVDQYALTAVLETHHIAAAYLDVTTPEPLGPDSPLWAMPHCYITPHSAGGHRNEQERLVRHFVTNLRRFERGEALADRVF